MRSTYRPNVPIVRSGPSPWKRSGPHFIGVKDERISSQVNQWRVVMTIAIVVGLLVLMGYFDALTGYWLGAVLGRLVLAGIAVVVLLALALHYWLGIGAKDLLWDTCMPSPPTPERPWHDYTHCAKGGK